MSILSVNHIAGRSGRITVNSVLDFTQSKGLVLPKWKTSQRPSNPEVGMTGLNIDDDVWEIYNGNEWLVVDGERNSIPGNQFVLLDATNTDSYPGSGTVWYDISGNNRNFNIASNAFNSGQQYMDFQDGNRQAKNGGDLSLEGDVSYVVVTRPKNSTSEWRTLTRSYSADHHVIIQSGAWNIGMYDNNSAGFIGTGYSQQSLPGYAGNQFMVMIWRWSNNDSPTYELTVNGSQVGTISNSNARYNRGFGSIGGYHNGNQSPTSGSQPWGDIRLFAAYDRRLTDAEVAQATSALSNYLF